MAVLHMKSPTIQAAIELMDKIIFVVVAKFLKNSLCDQHLIHVKRALADVALICQSFAMVQASVVPYLATRVLQKYDVQLILIH